MPILLALAFGAGLVIVFVAFVGLVSYNSVVTMRQRVVKAWANVEVALQQRHDELPNVVNAVRGEMAFEQGVLQQIVRLWAQFSTEAPIRDQATTSAAMTQALKTLFAVVERYPELRSHENVTQLQAEIERLETVIADRRELYNDSVYRYNSAIQQIPGVWFAGLFGWKPEQFFDAEPDAEVRPDVSLGTVPPQT